MGNIRIKYPDFKSMKHVSFAQYAAIIHYLVDAKLNVLELDMIRLIKTAKNKHDDFDDWDEYHLVHIISISEGYMFKGGESISPIIMSHPANLKIVSCPRTDGKSYSTDLEALEKKIARYNAEHR